MVAREGGGGELVPHLDDVRTFYGNFLGEEISRDEIVDQGWQCLEDEWEFNRRAGLGDEDDLMPDCMAQDEIGPDKLVWDVSADVVGKLYERPAQFRESLFALRPG